MQEAPRKPEQEEARTAPREETPTPEQEETPKPAPVATRGVFSRMAQGAKAVATAPGALTTWLFPLKRPKGTPINRLPNELSLRIMRLLPDEVREKLLLVDRKRNAQAAYVIAEPLIRFHEHIKNPHRAIRRDAEGALDPRDAIRFACESHRLTSLGVGQKASESRYPATVDGGCAPADAQLSVVDARATAAQSARTTLTSTIFHTALHLAAHIHGELDKGELAPRAVAGKECEVQNLAFLLRMAAGDGLDRDKTDEERRVHKWGYGVLATAAVCLNDHALLKHVMTHGREGLKTFAPIEAAVLMGNVPMVKRLVPYHGASSNERWLHLPVTKATFRWTLALFQEATYNLDLYPKGSEQHRWLQNARAACEVYMDKHKLEKKPWPLQTMRPPQLNLSLDQLYASANLDGFYLDR